MHPSLKPILQLVELMESADLSGETADPVSVSLVAAIGRRGELGLNGQLVFRLKADMANFRKLTAGKPLVMGRKTWESFPKRPLPGRPNLVVSRNLDFFAPGAFVWSNLGGALEAARAMAAATGVGEVCVIGGAEIFALSLASADRLWLTEVEAEASADAFFPQFDRNAWREASAARVEADESNQYPFVIREWVRRA